MPAYDFMCDHCGHKEELYLKIAEMDSVKECPECGKNWRRLVSAPGMVTIHDCQGKADLFHKRVTMKSGKAFNTTDGYGSRYYYKNNPSEDPRIVKRKMENDNK